jgi:S-(hydroxymethyl)glutathione dehydrogenase/alcohol dehydrogenase
MKTLAAVLNKINHPLSIEELTIPDLKQGQVLVQIAYSGICHSQLNEIRGLKGEDKFLPHTLGHEGSGIVERVGSGVKKVKVGDRVVLTWIKGGGLDFAATLYKRKDGSIVNSGAISTFMNKAVISENRLVKIPDEMPLREAALLGCAIPTGAGVIINTAKLSKGDTVVVFGIGGIGLSALLAAKFKQAAIIIAVDIFDNKLDDALQLGATHVINAKKQDVLLEILKITDKRGVDYAVECAGKKESMEIAFKSVRDKGGICVIAGNLPQGEKISIDPFDLIKGKQIIGTWGGEANSDKDIQLYASMYLEKKLNLNLIPVSFFRLEQINLAVKSLEDGNIGRAIIEY